eukprot:jgi/Chrzof1/11952/Cz06g15240.t1
MADTTYHVDYKEWEVATRAPCKRCENPLKSRPFNASTTATDHYKAHPPLGPAIPNHMQQREHQASPSGMLYTQTTQKADYPGWAPKQQHKDHQHTGSCQNAHNTAVSSPFLHKSLYADDYGSWKHPTSTMHVNSSSSSSSTRADSTRRPDAPLECASLYKRDYMPWQKASPGRPYIKTHKPKKHKQPAWQPGSLASEYGREYHKLDTPQTKQQSAAAARQAADADAAHCTFGAFDAHTIYTDTYTAKHGRMRPSCKASGHKNAPGIASRVFDDSTTYKACFTAKAVAQKGQRADCSSFNTGPVEQQAVLFEGESTHKADYQKWPVVETAQMQVSSRGGQPQVLCSQPFLHDTTYKVDFNKKVHVPAKQATRKLSSMPARVECGTCTLYGTDFRVWR